MKTRTGMPGKTGRGGPRTSSYSTVIPSTGKSFEKILQAKQTRNQRAEIIREKAVYSYSDMRSSFFVTKFIAVRKK